MQIDLRAWLRLPLPTQLLGGTVLALGVAILVVISRGTQAEVLLATAARVAPPLNAETSQARKSVDLAAIQRQPLLHSTRAFYRKPVESAPVTPPRPDYRLAGTMILPGKTPVAVIMSRVGNESRRIKPGDEVGGWRVAAIERKRVSLSFGDERAEINSGAGGNPVVPVMNAASSAGLKRVPMKREQVTAVGAGVVSLGAQGASPARSGSVYSEPPRLYRPPPQ